jgi:hypothetical protein
MRLAAPSYDYIPNAKGEYFHMDGNDLPHCSTISKTRSLT